MKGGNIYDKYFNRLGEFRKEIDERCFSEPTIKKKRKIPYLIDQHKLESKDA